VPIDAQMASGSDGDDDDASDLSTYAFVICLLLSACDVPIGLCVYQSIICVSGSVVFNPVFVYVFQQGQSGLKTGGSRVLTFLRL